MLLSSLHGKPDCVSGRSAEINCFCVQESVANFQKSLQFLHVSSVKKWQLITLVCVSQLYLWAPYKLPAETICKSGCLKLKEQKKCANKTTA